MAAMAELQSVERYETVVWQSAVALLPVLYLHKKLDFRLSHYTRQGRLRSEQN